jgi:hypothetical protein
MASISAMPVAPASRFMRLLFHIWNRGTHIFGSRGSQGSRVRTVLKVLDVLDRGDIRL